MDINHQEMEFGVLWERWHNSKNRKRSKSAFMTATRGKSNEWITDFVKRLKIDCTARTKAKQLGFDQMMLSSYLNGERYEDDITNENNDSVKGLTEERIASDNKARELFGR